MNTCGLTTSVTALANALTCQLTSEEASVLAAVLVQLGDTLATIITARTLCEKE